MIWWHISVLIVDMSICMAMSSVSVISKHRFLFCRYRAASCFQFYSFTISDASVSVSLSLSLFLSISSTSSSSVWSITIFMWHVHKFAICIEFSNVDGLDVKIVWWITLLRWTKCEMCLLRFRFCILFLPQFTLPNRKTCRMTVVFGFWFCLCVSNFWFGMYTQNACLYYIYICIYRFSFCWTTIR